MAIQDTPPLFERERARSIAAVVTMLLLAVAIATTVGTALLATSAVWLNLPRL